MVVSTVLQYIWDPTSLLVVAICVLATWYIFRDSKTSRYPPGPRPWPIVGNLLQVRSMKKDLYEVGVALQKQYGDIVFLRMGPFTNIVFVNGSDMIHKAALHEKFRYRPNTLFVINYIFKQKGVIFGNGDVHTALRRFTLGALRDFGVGKQSLEERIQEEARMFVELIENKNGAPFNYFNNCRMVVANVIASIVYGNRFEYDDPDFHRLINDIDTLFKTVSLVAPENAFPFLRFLPGSKFPKIIKVFKDLEQFATGRIAEHRQTFDPDNIRDFVDLYLKHEGTDNAVLTEDNMFRVIVDLFSAGTDTTATTIIWAMLHLIRNPDVQTKCREEILNVVGSERNVKLEDKHSMPYLQAFINEVLRYSAIAPISPPHTCFEDVEFEGYLIPKNSVVVFNLYSTLMDPDVWEHPEEFRPERFLTSDGKLSDPHEEFIPFSVGARNCLGKHLARIELFLFLGTLIQRLEFKCPAGTSPPSAARYQTGVISKPADYNVCAFALNK